MIYGYRQEKPDPDGKTRMAVVVFLPEPLNTLVARLREQYDPDYAVVAPHISIVSPFETDRPVTEEYDLLLELPHVDTLRGNLDYTLSR